MYPNPLQIWQTHTDRELIKQKLTHADVFLNGLLIRDAIFAHVSMVVSKFLQKNYNLFHFLFYYSFYYLLCYLYCFIGIKQPDCIFGNYLVNRGSKVIAH